MSQTHIIVGGIVANTIVATVAEAQAAYPDAVCIPADTGGIGWLWDGETLTPPPPEPPVVPHEVTMRQARLALYSAGMLDAAQAVIDALPMPQRRQAQIEWEYALSVRRDHPLIALMIAEGLATAEQVDGLFVAAAGL